MIRGTVNARLEAVVRLRVRGPGGAELDVDAVIDTGFTASLTLPAAAVAALGLVRQSGSAAAPATGRSGISTSTPRRWSGTAPGAPCWRRPSATRSSLGCGCWPGMNCVSRSCRVARPRSARSLEEREAPPSRPTCSPGKTRKNRKTEKPPDGHFFLDRAIRAIRVKYKGQDRQIGRERPTNG
jgi:hypothetical protein